MSKNINSTVPPKNSIIGNNPSLFVTHDIAHKAKLRVMNATSKKMKILVIMIFFSLESDDESAPVRKMIDPKITDSKLESIVESFIIKSSIFSFLPKVDMTTRMSSTLDTTR